MYLENTIRTIRVRLGKSALPVEEVEDLQLQLTLAESALEHYRQAYELELSVSGPEPPQGSRSESDGGDNRAERWISDRKKDGLTLNGRRSRNKRNGAWALRIARNSRRDAFSTGAGD